MVRVKKGCDLMKTNTAGIKLIQSFESCKLKAYKAVATEKYYTILFDTKDSERDSDTYRI